MASFVFNHFKEKLIKGGESDEAILHPGNPGNAFCVALVTSAVFNTSTSTIKGTQFFQHIWDISNNSGYNSSGYTSGAKLVYVSSVLGGGTTTTSVLFSDVNTFLTDIVWTDSTIDARGAVIYQVSTGLNVIAIDFGEKKSSTEGTFRIKQDTSKGFIQLTS